MGRSVKRLLILGSTGSIGTQALDVVARSRDEFEVVGLSAGTAHEDLIEQARAHGVRRIALSDPDAARPRRRGVDRAARCWAARRAWSSSSRTRTPTSS